ncbi:MAG: hypothetical protein QOG20_2966 [Pseudonocardiales bacterium]|jgi:uncharacterized protein (DUF305 family)|nr:hypothetical protein [Pseudonocardiales bacterium]
MSTETALPPVDDDPPVDGTDRREPGWVRPFIVAAGVLVLLLIGATGGLLVARSGSTTLPIPAADSVDVEFAQDMSVHHQQATQMASWERDHTTDPDLHQLSYDIESTQTAQIGRMQGWLELWGASAQPVSRPYMTWMAPDAMHGMTMSASGGVTTMPGMASAQDLKNLRAATGKQLDVLFLQLMLRHHEGGASMLSDAAQHASQPQVRNLAAQMLSSQTAEADYMKQLLAQRGASPLPL